MAKLGRGLLGGVMPPPGPPSVSATAESGAIQKLGCSLVFAFHSNYGHIFNRL